ncbi:hypothetical protein N0B44_31440 [Roseibacterium beibuensis]|uniref:hypothetical protein n=1 Tax=[Roseibacterium] beibuensis TaxID=1193142 RepID=UPI00217D94D3|nr:hypothetical protein [Roseibacterium beibuensis]MCS6627429.1 hypothetical protein [Roseibacterium beibuensis]
MYSAMALAAALLAAGGSAVAQDAGDDWDFGEDPAQKLSIAAVSFENFGVAVRCMDGSLSVLMAGLPADSGRRSLSYRVGQGPEQVSNWISSPGGTTAFAFWPRAVARDLSEGGRLTVVVPTDDGSRRISADIPRSREAVARVFRDCDRELTSGDATAAPRDEDFVGLVWLRQPDGSFPDRARYADGIAAVQCLVRASGRLGDCTVESEFPEGSGFGRAAVLASHRTGRVGPAGGGDEDIEGRSITFTMRYGIVDNYMTPPPSRLPDSDKGYNDLPPED